MTVSSRRNTVRLCFGLISTTDMIFGQPHAPTNDQIQRYIDHIYEQMEIACNVLMTWQYGINEKKFPNITTQTKSMPFLPFLF